MSRDNTPQHPAGTADRNRRLEPDRPTERLGDQLFAALGYGVAIAGLLATVLTAHSDELRPGSWFAILIALLTPVILLAIRRRI